MNGWKGWWIDRRMDGMVDEGVNGKMDDGWMVGWIDE